MTTFYQNTARHRQLFTLAISLFTISMYGISKGNSIISEPSRNLGLRTVDEKKNEIVAEMRSSDYDFFIDLHKSEFPVKAAGEWVYKPEQATRPSREHLQCLNGEVKGNCHDPNYWKQPLVGKAKTSAEDRHKNLNKINNSPGMLAANDTWVWESSISHYKIVSEQNPDSYRERVRKILSDRKIFLVGDSLTRQWYQTMICELVHVLGYSVEEAKSKVIYTKVFVRFSELDFNPFTDASERDYVVYNIGHHVGFSYMDVWPPLYTEVMEESLKIDFGAIPDEQVFFRTTSVRLFHRNKGDWNTANFEVGDKNPNMNAQWELFGGNYQEQPLQNLMALEIFKKSSRKFQILDTSPMTLGRTDTSFDGCHFCIPGPTDHWSRMLYYQMELRMNASDNQKTA